MVVPTLIVMGIGWFVVTNLVVPSVMATLSASTRWWC